jgi:hypothetical protein
MADLSIIASGVAAANANTVTATGYSAAGTIAAGQVIWLNSGIVTLAGTAQAGSVAGIALNSTFGTNQLVTYALSGDVLVPTNAGSGALANGTAYVLSANGGGSIAPSIDPSAGGTPIISLLGMAVNPSTLRLNIMPVAAIR